MNGKKFREYFGEIEGEKLKRAPKGYEPDHPEIELLKYKSFLASNKVKDAEVVSKNFLQHGTDVFKTLFPFDQFLNRVWASTTVRVALDREWRCYRPVQHCLRRY